VEGEKGWKERKGGRRVRVVPLLMALWELHLGLSGVGETEGSIQATVTIFEQHNSRPSR
jgi:hypothetical protein